MPWCHRIAKKVYKYEDGYEESLFDIREYYYDNRWYHKLLNFFGFKIKGSWTINSISPCGESLDSLEWVLKKMLETVQDAKKDSSLIIEEKCQKLN